MSISLDYVTVLGGFWDKEGRLHWPQEGEKTKMCETTITYTSAECSYCGFQHTGTCPRIEEIEYYPDGTTKRIKFRERVSGVLWRGEVLIPFEVPLRCWCDNCGFNNHEADECPHAVMGFKGKEHVCNEEYPL